MKFLRHIAKQPEAYLMAVALAFVLIAPLQWPMRSAIMAQAVIYFIAAYGKLKRREVEAQKHEQDLIAFGTHLIKHRSRMNIAPITKTDVERWRKFTTP